MDHNELTFVDLPLEVILLILKDINPLPFLAVNKGLRTLIRSPSFLRFKYGNEAYEIAVGYLQRYDEEAIYRYWLSLSSGRDNRLILNTFLILLIQSQPNRELSETIKRTIGFLFTFDEYETMLDMIDYPYLFTFNTYAYLDIRLLPGHHIDLKILETILDKLLKRGFDIVLRNLSEYDYIYEAVGGKNYHLVEMLISLKFQVSQSAYFLTINNDDRRMIRIIESYYSRYF